MDAGVAEDVAQDAFVRMRDRFVNLDNPAGYLRVAVVNCARSATSADARRRAREARFSEERTADDPPVSDVEALEALRGLPFDQRAALVLRHWLDWSDHEIAAVLKCRPATVRSHLRRGRRALQVALGEDET